MHSSEQSRQSINFALSAILMSGMLFVAAAAQASGTDQYGNEDPNKKILKSGLLGAGTGAIASGASGGDAGKGALIGAGTNVIGGALLDSLTSSPAPQPQYQQQYQQQYAPAPQYQQQQYGSAPVYDNRQQAYYQPAPVYQQPAEDPNKKILKSGLLGAGTGAIAASASGGSAGKGALIGAGTNVIGGALLDSLMGSPAPAPQPQYYQQQPQYYQQQQQPQYYQQQQSGFQTQPKKKIIRKYDSEGNVISEEEVYE
jgi:hypothetical protein